jgi:hypothetical protein
MRFQVNRATHILWFWFKEIARWDLWLTKKKRRKKKERKKERRKRKEKEKRKKHKKKKKVWSLDEWILSKLGR